MPKTNNDYNVSHNKQPDLFYILPAYICYMLPGICYQVCVERAPRAMLGPFLDFSEYIP